MKKYIRRILFAGVLFVISGAKGICAENQKQIENLLLSQDFWMLSQDTFAAKAGTYGFRWGSAAKDSARSVDRAVVFKNEPVVETVVRFSSNTVSSVLLSFFNRGDKGIIDEQLFQKQVNRVVAMLDTLTGEKSRNITVGGPSRVGRKTISRLWEKSPNVFVLESAVSRDVTTPAMYPDFLNLSITRTGGQSLKQLSGEQKVVLGYSELKKRIKRTAEGDVYLDGVPMVDQGLKGYCAVATTERVMRYYGVEINQHELAQKASTAGMGTDPESLIKALKAMAGYLGVQIKILDDSNAGEFSLMVKDYNKVARKKKIQEIVLPTSGIIQMKDVYNRMDKTVFCDARVANVTRVQHFLKQVKEKLDNGFPVLWAVILGMVDEKPALPQTAGGHLRLIIGYNSRTFEIIYSDTWGAGHEIKRMSLNNAYTITTGLYTIEPR